MQLCETMRQGADRIGLSEYPVGKGIHSLLSYPEIHHIVDSVGPEIHYIHTMASDPLTKLTALYIFKIRGRVVVVVPCGVTPACTTLRIIYAECDSSKDLGDLKI